MSNLAGKVVLISGASSGIGAELARQAVARGAKVGILARREQHLVELAQELGDGNAAWAKADVCDEVRLLEALDQLEATLGRVDVIIANAGYAHPESPRDFRPDAARKMYDTNLFGMLRMIDWALPKFLERGQGHIVGMSSMASYLGMPYSASYSGSKAAMRVHLQSLRVALKDHGIAVTTLCPGFVHSALTEGAKFPTPFLLKTEDAVALMIRAIERRKGEVRFPWQIRLAMAVANRLLPTPLVERMLRSGAPT